MPTFHPAAALRGSARVLEEMRFDLAIVRQIIDRTYPGLATEEPADPAAEATQLDLFG